VANLIVSAVSTFDNKGLKKGQKEISAFDKQVSKLGRTFAGVFGATALLNFSKKAVAAFAADEKAAKSLEVQLRNTGFAFSAPAVENYIGNLQKVTGVLDDELRPSFQRLLTVTKSITQSQDALALALDLSAAGYGSVEQISSTLAKAYAGQTTALGRLGTGLSKATLATGNMNKIMAELQQKFAGQAQARLTTYAGKMDLLKVSTENAKEEIGKGLVDAISLLGKNRSIEDATTKMDTFAKSISDAIYGVGLLISKLDGLASKITSGGLGELLVRLQPGGLALQRAVGIAGNARNSNEPSNREGRSASRIYLDQLRKESKALQAATTLRKQENAQLKAKTEVDKLAEKFDVERIGLMKALNEATDADTKLRIQSKLAILDNNEALARKYNAELLAKEAADLLAEASRKAAAMLDAMPNKFDAMFTNLTALFVKGGSDLASAMSLAASSVRLSAEAAGFAAGTGRYAYPLNDIYQPSTTPTNQGTTNIDVTVNTGAVLSTNQDLTTYIQDALGNITKLGNGSLIPAGSIAFQ
jgi:hypothetical protein